MRGPRIWRLLAGAGLLVLAGCSDEGSDPVAPGGGGPTVSFAADVQPIFNTNCTTCHGLNGNGGLDLRPGEAYGNLVGVDANGYAGKRVVAGDPDASVIYRKLTGATGVGGPMPPAGMLPTETTDIVRQWIAAGAAEN